MRSYKLSLCNTCGSAYPAARLCAVSTGEFQDNGENSGDADDYIQNAGYAVDFTKLEAARDESYEIDLSKADQAPVYGADSRYDEGYQLQSFYYFTP